MPVQGLWFHAALMFIAINTCSYVLEHFSSCAFSPMPHYAKQHMSLHLEFRQCWSRWNNIQFPTWFLIPAGKLTKRRHSRLLLLFWELKGFLFICIHLNQSVEQDEEEGSCTKVIYALLLLDHSYTLFNGLNELTKYTEHSSLNINQGEYSRPRYHGYQMIPYFFRSINGWIVFENHFSDCSRSAGGLSWTAHQEVDWEPPFQAVLSWLALHQRCDWQLSHELKQTTLIRQTYFQLLSCYPILGLYK